MMDSAACETILICEIDLIFLFEQNPLFTFRGYFEPLPSACWLLPPAPGRVGAEPVHLRSRLLPPGPSPGLGRSPPAPIGPDGPRAGPPAAVGSRDTVLFPCLENISCEADSVLEQRGAFVVDNGSPKACSASGAPGRGREVCGRCCCEGLALGTWLWLPGGLQSGVLWLPVEDQGEARHRFQ